MVGLTGMGGGALMTPMLVLFFHVSPLAAVSSDLVASAVMKPVGSVVHLRNGTVRLDLVRWLCLGSVPAAFAGVIVARAMEAAAAARGPGGAPAPPGGMPPYVTFSTDTEIKDTVSSLSDDTDLKRILDADAFIKEEDLHVEMKKENEKGRGGFGVVYIGKLGGLEVAVKVMTQKSRSPAMATDCVPSSSPSGFGSMIGDSRSSMRRRCRANSDFTHAAPSPAARRQHFG